jgi:hypothetical protein
MTVDIATLGIKVDATQADKAAGSLDKLTAAGSKAEVASKKLTAAQAELADSAKRTAFSFDSLYDQAQRDYHSHYVAGAKKFTEETGKMGQSAKLTSFQLQNLSFQLNDVVSGLVQGQTPMRILAQQGGQVFQVLQQGSGGATAGFKSLLGLLTPARIAFGGLALGIGAATVAALEHVAAEDKLRAAVQGAGRAAGISAGQVDNIAKASANASNISVKQAREIEAALLNTGQVSGQVFATITSDAKRYAIATGQDIPQATAELAKAFASPAQGAELLSQRLGAVDGSTRRLIGDLVQQGRVFEAQQILARKFNESLTGTAKEAGVVSGGLSYLSHGFGQVTDAFGGFLAKAAIWLTVGPKVYEELDRNSKAAAGLAQQQAFQGSLNRDTSAAEDIAQRIVPGAQRDALRNQAVAAGSGALSAQLQGDADGIKRYTEAQQRLTGAVQSYLDPAAKAAKLADLDAKAAYARAPAAIAAIAAKRAEIEASGEAITAGEKQQRINDAYRVSLAGSTAALSLEAHAIAVDTEAALGLAEAYLKSADAGFKAEAQRAAAARAARGDISYAEAYQRQISQNVAEAVATGAKVAEAAQSQADAETHAADAIQIRGVAAAVAQRQMKDELALRPLVIAQTVAQSLVTEAGTRATRAQVQALNDAKQALEDHRKALQDDAAEQLRIANLGAAQQSRDDIAVLKLETTLLAASNAERAQTVALLRAEQEQRSKGFDPATASDKQAQAHDDAIRSAVDAAVATADLQTANDNYNASLTNTLDILQEIAAHTQAIGSTLGDTFGHLGDALKNIGKPLGDLLAGVTQYRAVQEQLAVEEKARLKASEVSTQADLQIQRDAATQQLAIVEQYTQKRKDAEDETNLAALDSFKNVFGQKTAAYKVLSALEIGLQAITLAGHAKQIASEIALTAGSIGRALARAAAKGAEAIAEAMSSIPFPLNLAAAAATAAALVAFGVKLFGGGGGGGGLGYNPQDLQKAAGTGSVLGDAAAKSDSIQHALDLVAQHTDKNLEYSNGMLRALKNIDNNIGVVAASLAKQLGAGGAFDTSKLSLGTSKGVDTVGLLVGLGPVGYLLSKLPIIGGIISSLFGTKKTTTLLDQGLQFDPQKLSDLLSGGIAGATYQATQTETKKKFFGFTYSDKTKTNTSTQDLDQDLANQLTLLVGSLRDGVVSAATALGVTGAQAVLDSFQVNLGKLSFKDLTGEEIQKQLEAVFSKLGDDMAKTILPAVSQFQKVGEGAFETLVRVAREYQVVDVSLESIGKTMGSVGVASIAAREHLIDLAGSLDDFVSQTQFFAENFLTDAEQIAPVQAAVVAEFQRLGVTGVNSKDTFKQLVLGLDLTTDAGQYMYAALLKVAPAFLKVSDYLTQGSKDISDARDVLSKAYQRESSALQDTIDKFKTFADTLRSFRLQLDTGANALLSPEAAYNASRQAFLDTSAKARLGDPQALQDLQSVSQAYLDASKSYYASSGRYFADLADVKSAVEAAEATATRTADNATQQLDALKASVSGLIKIDEDVVSVHDAIVALTALLAAAGGGTTANPFSPGTSATGSTLPGYTYTPPVVVAPVPAPVTLPTGTVSPTGLTPEQIAAIEQSLGAYGLGGGGLVPGFRVNAFATGGSFTVGGSGSGDSQNFGAVNLSPGEVVNVSRRDTMEAVVSELRTANQRLRALEAKLAAHGEATVAATDRGAAKTASALDKGNTTQRLLAGGLAA